MLGFPGHAAPLAPLARLRTPILTADPIFNQAPPFELSVTGTKQRAFPKMGLPLSGESREYVRKATRLQKRQIPFGIGSKLSKVGCELKRIARLWLQ